MNCRIIFSHCDIDRRRLTIAIAETFGSSSLNAHEWKNLSEKYKGIDAIEKVYIWGGHNPAIGLIYGFLEQDPRTTMMWIERNGGGSVNLFAEFKRLAMNGVAAIWRAKPKLRVAGLKIADHSLYERVDTEPCGLSVTLSTARDGLAKYSVKEIIAFSALFFVTIGGQYFWDGSSQDFRSYIASLGPFKLASLWTLSIAIIWNVAVVSYGIVRRRFEVVFRS